MNILYLAHRIPHPPNKGDKLRAFRQIQRLSERHRVWCACFVDDPHDFRHVKELENHCERVAAIELRSRAAKLRGLWSLSRGGTITERYYSVPQMTSLLKSLQRETEFDAVVAFSSGMAPYALEVRAPRRVLDLCDLDSRKWSDYAVHLVQRKGLQSRVNPMRHVYGVESRRLAAAELRWIDSFDATLLATDAEAEEIRKLAPRRKLHVVGNGVDLPPLPEDKSAADLRPVVGFVGVMDYLPNVDAVQWFATDIWPRVREQIPDAEFRILGRSPCRSVRQLNQVSGVRVVGEVPQMAVEIARLDVSVAPLRIARGIQNKVLEAMAAAKAVVLTSKAAKGIGAVNQRDYLVADNAESFAGAVASLLKDAERRRNLGEAGRNFVGQQHLWDRELQAFESIVTDDSRPTFSQDVGTPISKSILALPLLRQAPQSTKPLDPAHA